MLGFQKNNTLIIDIHIVMPQNPHQGHDDHFTP